MNPSEMNFEISRWLMSRSHLCNVPLHHQLITFIITRHFLGSASRLPSMTLQRFHKRHSIKAWNDAHPSLALVTPTVTCIFLPAAARHSILAVLDLLSSVIWGHVIITQIAERVRNKSSKDRGHASQLIGKVHQGNPL